MPVAPADAVRLSICIPTLDGRATSLTETLESIDAQLEGELRSVVEVCISDTASQDGTAEVVEEFQRRGLPVTYRWHERNEGLTQNIFDAAALGTGAHLWLFSSDDTIAPDGIVEVLRLIGEHGEAAGITVARANLDAGMRTEVDVDGDAMLPATWEESHVFRSAEAAVRHCGLFQTYLSSQIVRRDEWASAVARHREEITVRARHFPHLWVFGYMLECRPRWVWHPAKLVNNRTQSSLLAAEVGGRDALWVLSVLPDLTSIWATQLDAHGPAYRELIGRLLAQWGSPAIIAVFRREAGHDVRTDVALLVEYVRRFWRLPDFWRRTAPVLLFPACVADRVGRLCPALTREMPVLPADRCRARIDAAIPARLSPRRNFELEVEVSNTGSATYRSTGEHPVLVAWRCHDASSGELLVDIRRALPAPLAPGGSLVVRLVAATPPREGTFRLTATLLQEGVRWFDEVEPDSAWSATVEVAPALSLDAGSAR
ncbi:MAG: glycosyltransferase [Actinomycetota bacterium]|nr:glycosyltransferase [Actinomycetota bacterium]